MSCQVFLLRLLASGGSADVHLGQRSDTGEHVVVKYLREWHLPHARKGFEREVHILRHNLPGMIPMLFADTAAQQPRYVMPYHPGGSVTRYAGRLSEPQLLALATQTARALATLHGRRIFHGDFKPDNILVTQQGTLQLADPLGNGIGCTFLFSQNRGGTPGYWAPEIRAGRPISQSGDAYSYGAALYHLSTGRKPQDGERLDLLVRHQVMVPKIREIITACCQPNPAARPSMEDVLRLLAGASWPELQAVHQQQRVGALFALGAVALVFLAVSG
jgi:eukaryotic-like serine/threonine-protein kinase